MLYVIPDIPDPHKTLKTQTNLCLLPASGSKGVSKEMLVNASFSKTVSGEHVYMYKFNDRQKNKQTKKTAYDFILLLLTNMMPFLFGC